MRVFISLLLSVFICAPAFADDLMVRVNDASGRPVANVLVMTENDGGRVLPEKFAWENRMEQVDQQFNPFVLAVPAGSDVSFPNLDRVRHHVYSFAKGNRFELKLYGKDETRSVTLKNQGIVAVGCNIHDDMIGYIRVVETPFVARTDENGVAVLKDAPEGVDELILWHPNLHIMQDDVRKIETGKTEYTLVLDIAHQGHRGMDH